MSPAPGEKPREGRFVAVLLHETQVLLDDKLYYGPMLQGLTNALTTDDQARRLGGNGSGAAALPREEN